MANSHTLSKGRNVSGNVNVGGRFAKRARSARPMDSRGTFSEAIRAASPSG
jgi:hypothetical protein